MVDKAKVTMKYYSPFPSGLDTNRQNIKSQVLFPPQASSIEDGIFNKEPRGTPGKLNKQDQSLLPKVREVDIFQTDSAFRAMYMTIFRTTDFFVFCISVTLYFVSLLLSLQLCQRPLKDIWPPNPVLTRSDPA